MIGQAIGAGIGLATAKWQDRRQVEQQKKLQDIAIAGNKEMGKFNQGLALDMWEKTNYAAQRKQMEKAGLNVGLMYGGGGAGGTSSTPTGNVGMGSASSGGGEIGMGMQLGLAAEQQAANIELTKAQTQNVEADTEKKTGVDTDAVRTGIENMKQATENAQVQNAILQYEKDIAEYEANVANMTQEERINQAKLINDKLAGEVQSAKAKGIVDEKTVGTMIENANLVNKQLIAQTKGTEASTEATKASQKKTEQETLNLLEDQIFKKYENELSRHGVNSKDNPLFKSWVKLLSRENEGEPNKVMKWLYDHRPSEWFK